MTHASVRGVLLTYTLQQVHVWAEYAEVPLQAVDLRRRPRINHAAVVILHAAVVVVVITGPRRPVTRPVTRHVTSIRSAGRITAFLGPPDRTSTPVATPCANVPYGRCLHDIVF